MITPLTDQLQRSQNTNLNVNDSPIQETQQPINIVQPIEKKVIKKKKEKESIGSMESFIRSVMISKRVVINDKLLRILKDKSYLTDALHSQLLEQLVSQDRNLDISRQLMLAALNAYSYPRVSETLRGFAKEIICAHPALKNISANDLFPVNAENVAKYLNICTRFTRLIEDNYQIVKTLRKDKEKRVDKDKNDVRENMDVDVITMDIKALKNALYASAAWRILCRLESSDQILAGLQHVFFTYKPEARQREIDFTTLLCAGSGDSTGLNALINYQSWSYEQEKLKSTEYSVKLNRVEATLELKTAALDEATKKNVELMSTISRLQFEVKSLQEQRQVDLMHFNDEKEQQRAHTLKVLESDVMLISESLVALTREPPKVNVAQNYMGSVNESLQKEISYLKEQK